MSHDVEQSYTLPLDAFVRSISVNRKTGHAFFLGAGASISSGVASATTCVWTWKRDIVLSNNPRLRTQFENVSLASVQTRIQKWLDSQGEYPSLNAPDEYGFYAERCYPIAQDRQRYFEGLVAGKEPYVGYQLLCLLAKADVVSSVWTTNFDGLTNRAAAAAGVSVIEVGLDTAGRLSRPHRSGELWCVALHGDYRYDALKNTDSELREQDSQLRQALIRHLKDTTLIVVGYSGRDASVMEALAAAYSEEGSGRLYWCGYGDSEPSAEVRKVLDVARAHKREAYYVPSEGFDDLMVRLASHCLTGSLLEQSQKVCATFWSHTAQESMPFTVPSAPTIGLIKSNAFAIDLPREIVQFEAEGFNQPGAWQRLRDRVRGTNIVAGLQHGKVLALGTTEEIKAVFADSLIGDLTFAPIIEKELAFQNGTVSSLLCEALVRALAQERSLGVDGELLWMNRSSRRQTVYGTPCDVQDAVKVYLRRYAGKDYVVIKPTVRGVPISGGALAPDVEKELKRVLLTKQYNREFNQALDQWRGVLFPAASTTVEFPPASGSQFLFTIRHAPAYARLSSTLPGSRAIRLQPAQEQYVVQTGTQYREPRLVFSNRQGTATVLDEHPLRGVVRNQPYDYPLTLAGVGPAIRVGVVCPRRDASGLAADLAALHGHSPVSSKREYLVDYPGFSQALGVPLELPQPGDSAWMECTEPTLGPDPQTTVVELGRRLTACIRALHASCSPSVIVVYIPERWREWDHFKGEGEYYDLHDFVKAYCVEQGIATQFLREGTLHKSHQCEVLWWLALALYVKSMRTPWALESLDADTAYLGLGFSIDPRAPRGEHVLLGCSHIYNSRGQGLQYRLNRLENAVLRGKNPFMSRDDARRMGEVVRQLFHEATMSLPKRVVVHKRTPFNGEERDGLLEGLAGVETVDMLEITIDKALRYVASKVRPDGRLEQDAYPVRRGTAVVLDRRRALLWVHGTATPLDDHMRYYQGKSRIPAPLTITRHYGSSPLGALATEVLGLSKMNWNTFDMYDKEPATIHSSNQIARVGALLQRLGDSSYDYRLFI